MSPPSCPPNVSPSGGSSANHNPENRSFSSPDAHRPGSANNGDPPLISPHHLGSQSFFPQQQQPPLGSIRPPTPSSPPGSVGSAKSAKNNNGSILERALASTIKQEANAAQQPQLSVSVSAAPGVTPMENGGGPTPMGPMDHWPQHPGHPGPQHYGEVLEANPFMKHELGGNLEYDLNYMAGPGGPPGGPPPGAEMVNGHQGVGQGHPHHLGGNRGVGGPGGAHHHHGLHHVHQHHEDHLHSPSQYSMAAQQPPWVR